MSKVCVTSDQHFFHKNILKFQMESGTRPFRDVNHMNDELIARHNSVVNQEDTVWYLGDFGFCNENETIEILQKLNGKKHFVFGNHDKPMWDARVAKYFETMQHYAEIKINGVRYVLFHFPIYSWNREHYGSIHLYGHTHNSIPYIKEGFSMDVGVDANMCYPFVISEIGEHMIKLREEKGLSDFRNARERDGEVR